MIGSDYEGEMVKIPDLNKSTIDLSQFEGTYRFTRYAQTTLDKLGVLIGLAPEITVVSTGKYLEIPKWNIKLHHVKDQTFYDQVNKKYYAFGKNELSEIDYFFTSGIGAYHSLKWYETIGFQIAWIGFIVVFLLASLIISIVRLLFVRNKEVNPIRKISLGITMLIFIFLGLLGYVLITTDPQQFVYGVPNLLKFVLILPFLFVFLQYLAIKKMIENWRKHKLKLYILIYHSVLLLVSIAIIPWLFYWNLLGFNY